MALETEGYCPVCRDRTAFVILASWLSENYLCRRCNSLPRHRALTVVLDQVAPDWREAAVHESSPTNLFFTDQCKNYSFSHYFDDTPPGARKEGVRCENLENLTFGDGTFDVFITQHVLEHVFDPKAALREVMRVLRDDGVHVFSAPKHKYIARSYPRAVLENGSVRHLHEPVYHGNPVGDGRSLVTWDYGANFDELLSLWSGYQTSSYVLRNRDLGIDGEYLDVFVTRKKESLGAADYLSGYLGDAGLLEEAPATPYNLFFGPRTFLRSLPRLLPGWRSRY